MMSRVKLLYGKQALLDEYNERVAEKLNTKSSSPKSRSNKTVGFIRGIHQMTLDMTTYHPQNCYLGIHCAVGGLFDTKKEFYRLISLLVSDLGLIFDVRSPSPWQIISELQTRGIIGESERARMKECLSIANEIRLKSYFAYNRQKEVFSPVPQYVNTTEQSTDAPIFRDFDEDVLVYLLSTSNDILERCNLFCLKYNEEGEVDVSLLQSPSVLSSKETNFGRLYFRLQRLPKALEWFESVPKDSPDYFDSLCGQAHIYLAYGEYRKSVECFEKALEIGYQNEQVSDITLITCTSNLAMALRNAGQDEKAIVMLEEAIEKHRGIHSHPDREGFETVVLSHLMLNLGVIYASEDPRSAIELFKEVEGMQNKLMGVPDEDTMHLSLGMAFSLSVLGQLDQSLEYLKQALQFGHKVFGKHNQSCGLARMYKTAGFVYEMCNQYDEALSWFKRSLELLQLIFRDNLHPGKRVLKG